MFTDIVGFTEFTAAHGDAEALALLDVQDRLVRAALPSGARIVKELGDGLLLWFDDAVPAVLACLALLVQFQEVDGDPSPLWVRMGMHWGSPMPRGDDLVGHDVNLAARSSTSPDPVSCSCRRTSAPKSPASSSACASTSSGRS